MTRRHEDRSARAARNGTVTVMGSDRTQERGEAPAPIPAPLRGLESFRAELAAIRMFAGRRLPSGHRGVVVDELQRFAIELAIRASGLRTAAVETRHQRLSPRGSADAAGIVEWCAGLAAGNWPLNAEPDIFQPWQLAFFESEAGGVARKVEQMQQRELFKLERETLEPLVGETRALAALIRDYTRRLRQAVKGEAGAYSGAEALTVIDWISDPWEGVAWDGDDYLGAEADYNGRRDPDSTWSESERAAA